MFKVTKMTKEMISIDAIYCPDVFQILLREHILHNGFNFSRHFFTNVVSVLTDREFFKPKAVK